ncbi:hypothetical protein ACWCSD_39770 [Nonomuraea sp. NPDC001684]
MAGVVEEAPEPTGVAPGDGDPVATPEQEPGGRGADPARATGDQDRLSRDRQCAGVSE